MPTAFGGVHRDQISILRMFLRSMMTLVTKNCTRNLITLHNLPKCKWQLFTRAETSFFNFAYTYTSKPRYTANLGLDQTLTRQFKVMLVTKY